MEKKGELALYQAAAILDQLSGRAITLPWILDEEGRLKVSLEAFNVPEWGPEQIEGG